MEFLWVVANFRLKEHYFQHLLFTVFAFSIRYFLIDGLGCFEHLASYFYLKKQLFLSLIYNSAVNQLALITYWYPYLHSKLSQSSLLKNIIGQEIQKESSEDNMTGPLVFIWVGLFFVWKLPLLIIFIVFVFFIKLINYYFITLL